MKTRFNTLSWIDLFVIIVVIALFVAMLLPILRKIHRENDSNYTQQNNQFYHQIKVIEYEEHDYLIVHTYKGGGITHSASCSNPIHSQIDQ